MIKNPKDRYIDAEDNGASDAEMVQISIFAELFEIRHEFSELNATMKEIRDFLKPKNY